MPLRFAANLSMLYNEVPFLERFAMAAAAGFASVEFLFPYEPGVENVRAQLGGHGLKAVLFNLPPGDQSIGEWGTLGNPYRRDYFRWSFTTALDAAVELDCNKLHLMFGQRVPEVGFDQQVACALENLAWAAPQAQKAGVMLLIEALNSTDFPRFGLHTSAAAQEVVTNANQPNLRLQYDVYHAQMEEGNLINTLTARLPFIGHIQIADVPGRHQPGSGEINYPAVFEALEQLGYQEYIGLEYRPEGETDASLEWLPREKRAYR